ncbi:unnamed protein product [Rotaria sordida]|uniref:Uncharacterized protein n=1 Tax=Rotaria sordida TaxID=392033 RepID=A0A813VKE5_9BILA|nr:unnamed protein product [Rotaria sordida]CAF0875686.1 unnamed protein product [Rotaria sordida]
MLCLIPLVIGSSFVFSKFTASETMNELMTYSKAGQIVQEVFSSLRTVLSLNSSKFEQKRYERELYSTRWSGIRQGAIFGVYTGWISLTTYLSFSEARGAAAAVFRLIDEGNDASVNETDVWKEDTEQIYKINGNIGFDNVNFMYPSRKDVPVLRNLSLIARAGQTTALVGSSGCGKSTCISLFLRYYEPSSGRITIDDRPITDYNIQHLRQNIGVVSQEPILFGMSIYENIRFGKLNASQAEIEQAAREANAHNFIMQLPDKYETLVGERGIQLSGGEKQRIALARALVKQPTFLLLDEATSALDNASEKIVQEALDRACKGRTTIVIAHRLTTIQNAHQIYVLDNGSVIEQGTHETLMAKKDGKYQAMVKCQQMEKVDDDKDDITSIQKAIEEEEKSILERSRLLSDSHTIDVNKYTAFAISGSKLTQRIRSKAFACLLRQEVAYFDRPENSSGAICTRLSLDASAVQEMIGTRLGVLAVEVIHNIRTVKQLSIEKEVLRQYSEIIRQVFLLSWKPLILSSMAYGIFWTVDVYTMAFIYWRALILVEKNKLSSNHIIMVFAFAVFSMQTLRLIGMISSRIAASISAAETFFDLFDRKPTIDNTSIEGQELIDFHGEIKFDQVKFIYPTRPTSIILNKFQLNIKPGQRVALVGASGCGKSTIIQLLERFYDVTKGRLLLDGIDIRQLNLHWVRSQFGLVSQEPILFDLTIAENIAYGLENVPMEDIINAASRANIHQFIEQLPQGYETKVGLKGSFLSGGEKQRIAIARVLIRRPKVLLLDEATSAMDSYNEQIVQDALEKVQREDPSRTSLIIAHRLSTIRSCDLICVLDRGHIVESGTHTELTQRYGAYYKMLAHNNLH